MLLFKEWIGKRVWIAIGFVTLSSIILTFEDLSSFTFSFGSLLVLAATCCWGLENNCTRVLSKNHSQRIVIIKGIGSGIGSLLIALIVGQWSTNYILIALALLLGFFSYGLSIYCYVLAQRDLGASRTSAYYALAPFLGVLIAWILFHEPPSSHFLIACFLMIVGVFLLVREQFLSIHHGTSHNDSRNKTKEGEC